MPLRALLAALSCWLCLHAELLPIRSYSTADGLPANQVGFIKVDSRGFVWLGTPEGLARFDGYRVTSFAAAEGLPGRSVQALLETRSHAYLVGTDAGLSQFHAGAARQAFVTYRIGNRPRDNNVTDLLEASDGRTWCATWGALFEMLPGPRFRQQALPKPPPGITGIDIASMVEDGCGKLWLGTVSGIYVLARDGAVQRITMADGLPGDYVNILLAGHDRQIWAGVRGGLAELRDGCAAGAPGVWQIYPGVVPNAQALAQGADGTLWAGTSNGLFGIPPNGRPIQRLNRSQGLTDRAINSLATDKSGNLWVGTEGAGAMMIEPGGFTTFHEQDGLSSDRVWSVLADRAGTLLGVAGVEDQTKWSLNLFDGARFRSIQAPKVFATYRKHRAWGSHRILLQSRAGEWWAATAGGLCRYAAVKAEALGNRAPEQCYFADETIFQLFEDSKGGIWASAQAPEGDRLMRWDPDKRAVAPFPEWPKRDALVKSFAEDRQGNIWLGMWGTGSLYRYDGRHFTNFGPKDGVPAGTVYALLSDSQGRLWIGADGGLGVVENPGAAAFRARTFDQSNGLADNRVHALVEDRQGYVYAATGAGIGRVNPKTFYIKRYSAADGVPMGEMESAFRDKDGNLWFATTLGLARLTPSESRAPVNPAVLITGVQAGGAPFAVSQHGETTISGVELEPSRNQLQVEFVAFGNEPEANLRYAYKLEGDTDWSAPRGQHAVNFAALGAGKYRFLVKAVNSDGVESATPAEVDFTVLPPFWRRWWFEGLAVAALAFLAYLLHNYRVSQAVSLERMRTAIATDLHDDIGSSLSQIAVLSEVARAGVNGENRRAQDSLLRVAVLAREMVDSLGDIVWSIRAVPDDLDALVSRMREFALDLFAGQRIDFELRSPPAGQSVRHLSLQARRHLFLMFKECIHNIARHSGCTQVKAEIKVAEKEIVLTVEDNGRGLRPVEEPHTSNGGSGIPGMRRRAEMLGGSVQFESKPGAGCTVSIRLPLRRSVFA